MPHIGDKSQNRCRHSYVNTERGDHESAGANTPLCSSPVRYTHPETMWGTVVCVCVERDTAGEVRDQCQPSFPADVCVCACFVCVWGGEGRATWVRRQWRGSKVSRVCVYMCVWLQLLFPTSVCVCVYVRGVLHHSVRDHISAPLTKTPIKLPTMKTKLNSYAPI